MRYSPVETFTDKIFYLFDSTFQWANRLIKSNPRTFIDIETIEDNETLVMNDGSLVSAVTIDGVSKAVLEEEFVEILDEAERKLMAYMSDGCHYPSFYFLRDTDGIDSELEAIYGPVKRATQSIGLEMDDLIQEQKDVLKKYCQKERAILLLWTNMNGLSKDEKRVAGNRKAIERKGMPLANDAQNLGMGAGMMLSRHKSFVSEFCQDLKNVSISTQVLNVHEFLREIRVSIDSEWTSDDWLPSLPGDPIPMRLDNRYKPDCSGMLWPRLTDQLFPRAAEHLDHATLQIGETAFAPITIELMPKSPEPFQALFKRLNNEKVPWRMNILVRSDGMSVLGFKELMASYMQFTPGAPENKYLVEVKKRLTELRDQGEEIVKLQVSLCTWAPAKDKELLEMRRAILARCVQGWGTCDVAPAEGDPLETMMSSTPGAVMGSVANAAAAPLYDALKMAPLTRPASPWKMGSQPLRTPDGKIMPYQPYSKLQSAWTTLIFAPMGYGKSMFMNYSNLSLILSPDNTELPFISILDIGPSSRGLISLLRGALPKEQRHLAMYERLLNTREYAVNVFDTRLGLRKPLSNQKAFLVNFLSYLATPDDKPLPPDGVLGMADTLVELAYSVCSDRKSAKAYQPEVVPVIDSVLETLGFEYNRGKSKWWDVVDFLYKNGHTHEATLAQRYAVPNLTDISHLANDSRIEAVYGDAHVEATSETLPKFFWRKITEAINKYPIISEETKFDLGEARVVSLDLDEVAKGQGADAKRRVGLMYMVAYYVLTNRFFTGKEHLGEMGGEVGIYHVDYRPYHKRFVESIKKMPKRFCIDEKHRVRGLGMVEAQLDESIREGRKWKVEVMQASQLPDDFSDESVRLATNIFILGGGNKANCEKVAETFKLSATMTQHLNESLRKPNKHGATLLSILETEKGDFEQLLMSTQGPTFLWACNSSSDDAYVRDTLSGEIGDIEARKLLVELYPAGNLDEEIEKRKRLAGITQRKKAYQGEDLSNRDLESEDTPKGILTDIVQDLMAVYRARAEKDAA
jgi:intracellular multiplication protein IcmB